MIRSLLRMLLLLEGTHTWTMRVRKSMYNGDPWEGQEGVPDYILEVVVVSSTC